LFDSVRPEIKTGSFLSRERRQENEYDSANDSFRSTKTGSPIGEIPLRLETSENEAKKRKRKAKQEKRNEISL